MKNRFIRYNKSFYFINLWLLFVAALISVGHPAEHLHLFRRIRAQLLHRTLITLRALIPADFFAMLP